MSPSVHRALFMCCAYEMPITVKDCKIYDVRVLSDSLKFHEHYVLWGLRLLKKKLRKVTCFGLEIENFTAHGRDVYTI